MGYRKKVCGLSASCRTNWIWLKASESDHSLLLDWFYFPGVFFPSSFISHKWLGHHWLGAVVVNTEAQNRCADNPAQLKCCCTKGPIQFSNKAKNYSGSLRKNAQWNPVKPWGAMTVGSIYTINALECFTWRLMYLGHVQHQMLFLASAYVQ